MTKSVGIDAGDYSVKAVELDGSYRRTRLLRCQIERVAAGPDGEERPAAIATAIAAALKAGKMDGDLVLGHPCREATLRMLEVPFKGRDAIAKVIKAEVEGAIQSQAVDDMIVDFHEIGPGPEGTKVLVAAVPKLGLKSLLAALQEHVIDPEHIDLDTMALYRVADWCGAFAAPDAAVGLPAVANASGDPGVAATEISAVIDLGSRSTRILLVDNGKLVDMRTIRLGDATIAEALARSQSLPIEQARIALHACLATGGDYQAEVDDLPPATVPDGKQDDAAAVAAPATKRDILVPHASVVAEQDAFLQRLSRELVRFLASTGRANRIGTVWVTGGGSQIGGAMGMLEGVFGCTPKALNVLGRLSHSLSEEEAKALEPQVATAIGLALRGLGGPIGFDLRQEELGFTRGFDRIKFPLAITCMVALFAALVYGVKLNNELKNLDYRIGYTFDGANADPKKPQFFGQLHTVLGSQWFSEPRNFELKDGSKTYGHKQLLEELAAAPVADRLKLVRNKLNTVRSKKQQDSGIYEEVSLESGLAVVTRFFEVLARAESSMGKYLLCTFELNMADTNAAQDGSRYIVVELAYRGEGFRERHALLREEIEEECKRPGSPFLRIDEKQDHESLFSDSAESGVPGYYARLRLLVRDSFTPFGG